MELNLKHDLMLLSPMLVVTTAAFVFLVLEALLKSSWSRATVAASFIMIAILGAIYYEPMFMARQTVFYGLVYADCFSWFVSLIILVSALLTVFIGNGKLYQEGVESPTEYYSLLLFCLTGCLIFVSSAELITLFVGLEIMSMPLYCLCGSALRSKASSESALKYFLLGSFSSAFLLYGIALIFGLTGSTYIADIIPLLNSDSSMILYIAMGLMLVGLVFKLGAVPFHFWAPDVYQGAPTPVTAFMATVVKAAAAAAALRILWTLFGDFFAVWEGAVWIIAVLTILIGNVIALRQRSVKRMLAYSSIAHAGYLLIGFLVPGAKYAGGAGILYYLVIYSLMTIGALGVVFAVTSSKEEGVNSSDISNFYGLSKSSPLIAFLMTIFMLSLAGLPPGMGGFLGKFYIFSSAIKANQIGISLFGIAGSLVSCYYYLRVIVAMYFIDAEDASSSPVLEPSFTLCSTLLLCAIGVVLLGIFPGGIYEVASKAVASIY
ncbi:MAG: NADH-quinone oxidoreductase subunit N [Bdellovibrionota bacterium]